METIERKVEEGLWIYEQGKEKQHGVKFGLYIENEKLYIKSGTQLVEIDEDRINIVENPLSGFYLRAEYEGFYTENDGIFTIH